MPPGSNGRHVNNESFKGALLNRNPIPAPGPSTNIGGGVETDYPHRGPHGRVPRVLLRDPTIEPTAKALWALLDDATWPDSQRDLSIADICTDLGIAAKTARKHLRQLEERGWLEIKARYGHHDGERLSNQYVMNWANAGVAK